MRSGQKWLLGGSGVHIERHIEGNARQGAQDAQIIGLHGIC
jgi:hypothetical protein